MSTRLLFLILLLHFCFNTYSQSFQDPIIVSDTQQNIFGQVEAMAKDLDSDGDLDLVYSSSFDKIIWLKNTDGLGTFEFQNAINLTEPTSSEYDSYNKDFDIADLDSDGDFDVLTQTIDGGKIEWIENLDGQGNTWAEHNISIDVGETSAIKAIDMDNDGDIDALAATTDSGLVWFENLDGLGSFDSNFHLIGSDASYTLNAIDIDDDGDIDVIANSDSGLTLYENLDGLGNFGSPNSISSNSSTDIKLFDLDNDNDNDIVILNYNGFSSPTTITWFENIDGLGNFSDDQIITTSSTAVKSINCYDMDSDGDFDVIAGLIWYENIDGLGSFSTGHDLPIDYVSNNYKVDLLFADLNNDGFDDAINTTDIHFDYGWFQNNSGDFNFNFFQTDSFYYINKIETGDIDGDLDNDIVLTSYYDGKVVWYENLDGLGNFSNQNIIDNIITSSNYYEMSISDVDADGDEDVIINYPNTISWYENLDGLGNFGEEQIIINDNTYHFISVDIDGDGDNDIIYNDYSTSTLDDTVRFLANDGFGNFSNPIELFQDDNTFLFAKDLDNDNDLDIVYIGYYFGAERKISWVENLDGLGDFGPENVITSSFVEPRHLNIEDLDYDGDLDIVVVSQDTGQIRMFENLDGLGNFNNGTSIQNGASSASLLVNDIDHDGYMDIIYSDVVNSQSVIKWKKNLFGTGFGNSVTINLLEKAAISLVDFDGDEYLDILYRDRIDLSEFGWLKNIGLDGNEINGTVRLDLDSNGCDVDDQVLDNILVTTIDDLDYNLSSFTYNNGFYQIFPGEGEFITSFPSELLTYFNVTPLSENTIFTDTGNTQTIDFCLEPANDLTDLNVTVYPSQEDPRPGFNTRYMIVVKNIGATIANGSIMFEYNHEKLEFLDASEPESSNTSGVVTFDFVDLNHFGTLIIYVDFYVFEPPIVNAGNILTSTVSVIPENGDNTEDDNTFVLSQTVVNSFDPNDIRVLEGEEILLADADKYLHYIIRFQNNGTASAINVRVNNPIDEKLDWTTLQIENLSHDGIVEVVNGSNISFNFEDINLPDSNTDEPNSHGYIAYKIKPKSNVIVGDIFYNRAAIYFDFNEPIVTNTVSTEIVDNLSVDENQFNSVLIYPNPVSNNLNIKAQNIIDTVTVYNLIGHLVKEFEPKTNLVELNLTDVNSGVYLVKIKMGDKKSIHKVIKR